MSISFLELPLELLHRIANEVPRLQDRKSLRLTCSSFGEVFRSHVLAEVTLNIHGDNLEHGINFLQTLVDEEKNLKADPVITSKYSRHIRTLYIDSLCPRYFIESEEDFEQRQRMLRYTFEVEEGARLWSEANFPSEQILIAETKLQSLLKPALESLYRLTAIRWRWHWRDSQWSLDTISECLEGPKLCRNMKEFTFAYHPSAIDIGKPFPLPNLKQLRVFSVSGAIFENDFKKIARHPIMSNNLKTLHLSQNRIRYSSIPFDIHIPATVSDLRLHGLTLESIGKVTYRNITSLDLGTLMSTNREWDALWDILSSQQIHLCDFAIHRITRLAHHDMDKMLNYFQSYSGLESFSLKGPMWYDPSLYDSYAIKFYENVLPMHVETLVKLELKPEFESKWCFGVDNINVLRRCKRLRSLWVKVDHRGLEPELIPERLVAGTLYGDRNSPMLFGSSSAGASYPNLVVCQILPFLC
ncbi:MAG: hypothetical protein NXY57DRAFT_413954 [Lentinula lateritia]|nr:MAG: hypothetical protein NXY57DRAFT_413954 [Lentinula lateritia]